MDDARKSKDQLIRELTELRRELERLKEKGPLAVASDERTRAVLDSLEDGYYEVDLRGRYTYVNRSVCRYHGRTAEQLLGHSFREFMQFGDTAQRVFLTFNQIYRTGVSVEKFEYQIQREDGELRDLEVSAALIRDSAGNPVGFRGISRDITERKRMEAEQERYRDFFENATDGCFEVDLSGSITFVNDAACRIFGIKREEFLGMNYRNYTHPETAQRLFSIYNEIYRTGRPAPRFEYEVMHRDGQIRFVETAASLIRDKEGKPVGFRGITRDITERKRMEAEQERYRDFLENIEEGCFEQDLAGNYTFVNAAGCRRFGYNREELLKLNYKALALPETAQKLKRIYNEIYRTGKAQERIESELIRKDGKVIVVETSATLIRDAQGNPVGFRGVSRDITEKKKLEEETRRLSEQLDQVRRLEALGTLAGGVAHDFNNLLMGIQGYTSLMLADIEPTHPFYDRLKAIEDQVKSAASLTRQLLGYARGGRYEVRPTDLNDVIRNTTSLFGRTHREVRIREDYTENLWTIEADQGQMEQVFLNLFVNAGQAMPAGGDLYLKTENVHLDEEKVRPYEVPAGPFVKVSVTDTGVGMDAKTLERIFEPFFTTREMGRGVGLGLAAVYGIVRGHGGFIEVESEKGRGATFTLYFPVSPKEKTARHEPATP